MDERVKPQGLRDRFARLSTGIKMVLVLGLALFPLGGIALFASLETARHARENRIGETAVVVEAGERRVANTITRVAATLRTAADVAELDPGACASMLSSLAEIASIDVRMAIFRAEGALICATRSYRPIAAPRIAWRDRATTMLDPAGATLRFFAQSRGGAVVGVAEFSSQSFQDLTTPLAPIANYRMTLSQGEDAAVVHDWIGGRPPAAIETVRSSLANGQIELTIAHEAITLRPIELLAIMLPVLMLVAAVLLGWLLVNMLLLRPLARLERAVGDFDGGPGEAAALELPVSRTRTMEIHSLGRTFRRVAETMSRNEAELEAGIAEQIRLGREVHHRVKNNLQIVASLLSLHTRGAPSPEAAEAYASIQRRVDALAIVQRNLLAEQEQGAMPARAVIAELASGLQQSAPRGTRLVIALDVADLRISQDIAVPIAFLLTELVEMAMLADRESDIAIELEAPNSENRCALLSVCSPALAATAAREIDRDRYARVLAGLARQLREPLERHPDKGAYSIRIPVLAD